MSTAHHHYNPDWLDDDALIANFVARLDEFIFLRDELARAPREGSVQHYLLVGVRGAGKTTLLKRLAVAIRRDAELSDHLIALSFPEELYQVKNLADFWWASCAALVDELDRLGRSPRADALVEAVEQAKVSDTDPLNDAGLRLVLQTCTELERRPVLLVDNLDLLFQRIGKAERKRKDPLSPAYWALREALSTSTAPLIIGGSVRLSEPFTDYDKAFYDFFIPKRLGKLSLLEARQLLERLADAQDLPGVKQRLKDRPSRIEALHELTGGNPRALGLIFELLRQGPNSRAVEDFSRLMDLTTPYYKSRFEDLAEQAQVVMHALAVRRPSGSALRFGHTAAEISTHTMLPTGTVSAQMNVLEREGLVEKTTAHGSRTQYRITEQLFRLWLQMRGTRRIRQNVIGLTEFLEAMFDYEEMRANLPQEGPAPMADARYAFAVAGASDTESERRCLEAHGAVRLLQHTMAQGERLDDYLSATDLPADMDTLIHLREELQRCHVAALSAEEQEALLGSVDLSLNQKQASVQALCDPDTAQAEAVDLRSRLNAEHERLLRFRLIEPDLDLFYSKRAKGLLPLPLLTPDDAEAACLMHDEPTAFRAMIWRLVGARGTVRFADRKAADDWLAWGLKHATEASSSEWANVAGSMDHSKCLATAQQALEQSFSLGSSSRAWFVRGILLQRTSRDLTEAESAIREAIRLDPTDALPWNGLGNLLAYVKRPDEAEAAFRKAIEIDPADATLWHILGLILSDQDRLEEAGAAYTQGAELDENLTPWWRKQRIDVQTRLHTRSANEALGTNNSLALSDALAQLAAESTDTRIALVSTPFVEGFLAPLLLNKKHAETVLAALRDHGYAKHAGPLLLAFEAALQECPQMLAELEPEVQGAAQHIFDRLTGSGEESRATALKVATKQPDRRLWREYD